ncbi:phosphatidate cytidylyltransferase [Streptomyces sp. MJP52]|uniref:phosphatidate cytidylyltransferase n=1 Tax=Streptomyces sp. MJP52 TaxID=2940555 RepID=UPI002473769B|nr:phosphatidate cytidylyltransferase [Streptomyces sp. MJP52]MDH6224725.1 phosphatidate cytidylyltransferase [Streptomyces sp. MJP52]
MNDSSWGAPPQAGHGWPSEHEQRYGTPGGPVQGAVPTGPAYDAHAAHAPRDAYAAPAVRDAYGDVQGSSGQPAPSGSHGAHGQPFGVPAQEAAASARHGSVRHAPVRHGAPVPQGDAVQHTRPLPVVSEKPQEPMSDASQPSPAPRGPEEPRQRKKKSAGRDLGAAIGVGVGLGVVVLVALFVVKAVFVGVVVAAVGVGLWELTSRLAERKGIKVPLVPLVVGGAAMVIAGYAAGPQGAWLATAFTALAVLVWRMASPPQDYLRDVTAGLFATFYVPFLATFVSLMLAADDGPQRVLTFLLLTIVSDTGAYAVGWRFGTHKLAPRISPGKTREGLLGAIGFSMAAGALCMTLLVDGGAWWHGLLMGLAVAVSATLGDLGESMIKRDLGIKDMGALLPGHGGIMDRLDSLLPTAPVVWLLLEIFVGS